MSEPRPTPVIPLHPHAGGALRERDDESLMALLCGGSQAAFEALVERHLPAVTRFCAKLVGEPAAGEDVAQEILAQVWWERGRYQSRGRFVVYLFTLARNRCLNQLRGARRRTLRHEAVSPGGPDLAGAAAPEGLDALLETERQREVRAALTELPHPQREALLLRFDQDLTYAEIAMVLGRPEATVRARVFHGLRRLRAQMGGER